MYFRRFLEIQSYKIVMKYTRKIFYNIWLILFFKNLMTQSCMQENKTRINF